jgi:O-antigen ligase
MMKPLPSPVITAEVKPSFQATSTSLRKPAASLSLREAVVSAVLLLNVSGLGQPLLCLAGDIVLLLVFMRTLPASGRRMVSALDWAVAALPAIAWISSSWKGQEFGAAPHATILAAGALVYFAVRASNIGFGMALNVSILALGAGLGVRSLYAFAARYHDWRALEFQHPELFRRQLSLFFGNVQIGNPTGLYLLLLPLVLAALAGVPRERRSRLMAVLLSAAAAVLASCLYLSFSRAAYFACFIACIITALLLARLDAAPRRAALWMGVDVILVVAAILLAAGLAGGGVRVATGRDSVSLNRSAEGRLQIYRVAWSLAKSYPLFGIGGDNFASAAVSASSTQETRPMVGQAFNEFLQIAAEDGLCSALLLAIAVAAPILLPFMYGRQYISREARAAGAFMAGGVAASAAYNMFWSALLAGIPMAACFFAAVALSANLADSEDET